VQRSTVQYSAAQCSSAVQFSAVQYSIAKSSIVKHSRVQYLVDLDAEAIDDVDPRAYGVARLLPGPDEAIGAPEGCVGASVENAHALHPDVARLGNGQSRHVVPAHADGQHTQVVTAH